MDGSDTRSTDVLVEECTVQQVLLKSLEDLEGADIDQEREELKREIAKLKRLIAARRTAKPQSSQTGSATGTPTPASPSQQNDLSTGSNMEHSRLQPYGSSARDSNNRQLAEPWSSPIPSRKRNTSFLGGVTTPCNKSRRTSPTPETRLGGNRTNFPQSLPDDDALEIIDLTGDDVDLDASCLAEQIREQKRRQQEQQDLEFALQLSSQGQPRPSSSNTHVPHNNAFSKIMATQQSNSRAPQTVSPSATSSHLTLDPQEGWMPGAYNPQWDYPNPSVGVSQLRSVPAQPWMSGSTLPYQPNQHRPPYTTLGRGFSIPPTDSSGYSAAQPPIRSNGPNSSIAEAIRFASNFDYANRLDIHGHAVSGRLGEFLRGEDDEAVTGKELDDLLKNIRPDVDMPQKDHVDGPPGLRYPLYRHQEVALTWMKKMEEGTNKGGILADDMGLGKTISTLALMLSRQASSRPKTNLIVGPLSLIRQWEEEIYKKTRMAHRLSVFIYHNCKATTDDLLKYDVVLTTYGTLAQEFGRREQFEKENHGRNINFNDKELAKKFPLLNPEKAKFHRIILDEAQCIKNRNTKTAKAAHQLRATYRWCLTGTPMMNGVKELFSLIKFLRIKPYCKWEEFSAAFGRLMGQRGDAKSVAMNRLRAMLKAVMLRRKKDSKLDGKPILELPQKTEKIVYAELSADEKDFYIQLEQKAQVLFSKYLREGSIGKNYSSILVLLLRLRQACCHPHLNLDVDDAVAPVTEADVEKLVKDLDQGIVERIKAIEAFECPICYDAVQAPLFMIPCGHDSCKDCLARIADAAVSSNIQEGSESHGVKCPVCRGFFDPKKCFSYDLFRTIHMSDGQATIGEISAGASGDDGSDMSDSESDSESDDDDVDSKGNLKDFIVNDSDEDDLEDLQALGDLAKQSAQECKVQKRPKKEKRSKEKASRSKKGKGKASDVKPSMLKSLRVEAMKNQKAYKRYMKYLRKTWMPAAKVTECINLLRTIGESDAKTIIFSQWTLLLDLLEVAMWHDKMPEPIRYDGSMSGEQRSVASKEFRDKASAKVMLVSLRAGNAGLNLTAATRVIIMDPFWNPYIEMQAIDRAYRIGQTKEVEVFRILTQDTVEDRIVDLQMRKKEIVEAALDESEGMKIGRLNERELRFLFNT